MAMGPVQSMAGTLSVTRPQLVLNFMRLSVWSCSQKLPTERATRQRTARMSSSSYWNFANQIADRQDESLGKTNLTHTLQRRDHTVKPAEVHQGNGCLTRAGLLSACSALRLSFASTGVARELDPISSYTSLTVEMLSRFVSFLGDLDPWTAQLATSFVGPVITIFNLLFIFRIVMSWYPGIPVKKLPFFLVYNPTEPVLGPTRRLVPSVGGVDVAPVIWLALMSFANEILLGKQGLLVLLSQQQP